MKTNQNWKAPPGRPRTTRRRNQKHCHPVRRVTRPARGAVFLKISLTRHRAFRDGYPLDDRDRDRDLNFERPHLFDKKVYIMEAWTERNQGLLRTAHGLAWRGGNSRGPGTAQGNAEPGEAHSFHP